MATSIEHAEEHTLERRRFTAEQVWRMLETGVISEDERLELIEGELVVVNPQGPVHNSRTALIRARLAAAYGDGFDVRVHRSVVGTVDSIPEPDLAVVRGAPGEPSDRLPGPSDIPLVVEISYSTHAYDRRKSNVYATAGYATYWLVDVPNRRVEVRSALSGGLYTRTEIVAADGSVMPPETNVALRVVELLPDRS